MNRNQFFTGLYRLWGRVLCPLLLITLAACSVASTASSIVTLPPSTAAVTVVSFVETVVPSPTATPTFTPTPVPSATPIATAIPLPTHADWKVGQALVVSKRAGAWLRPTPDSTSGRIISVLPNGTAVTLSGPTYDDGVQWWWLVNTADGEDGWLEESALNLTASKNWDIGQQLIINKTPDVWLRVLPSSTSDQIVAVLPYQTLVVVSGEPTYDGVQWWWQVTARADQSGWVEQDSLIEYVPPTAIPHIQAPFVVPVNPITGVDQPPGAPPHQPTIEQPPIVQPPPNQPPVQHPPDVIPTRPPPPTVELPPNPPATQEQPVEQPPLIPATEEPPSVIPTTPPPEFPPTVVAVNPGMIALAPSVTPAPAAQNCQHRDDSHIANCMGEKK